MYRNKDIDRSLMKLRPGDEEIYLPRSWFGDFEGWARSTFHLHRPGSLASYRRGVFHAHDLGKIVAVHRDYEDPYKDPIGHLVKDAPQVIFGAAICALLYWVLRQPETSYN